MGYNVKEQGEQACSFCADGQYCSEEKREMEKYFELVCSISERVVYQAEQGIVLFANLEGIDALLIAAECVIEAANKAG